MGRKVKVLLLALITLAAVTLGVLYIDIGTIVVLAPMGEVAAKERDLLINSTLLMLIIIVPVFVATVWIAWKYRASNKKAQYDPSWDNSNLAEFIWWMVPCVIIAILSVMTWKSCYDLNPFKPMSSAVAPLRIQVVALQWKWLFIYPDHGIASLGWVQFPKEVPLNFEVTSDAPMNSFWIPQLGGQIYAMPGMRSKLHLVAHQEGDFRGSSANLSGEGFARMTFQARACTGAAFDAWVREARGSSDVLTEATYDALVLPSVGVPKLYVLHKEGLFDQVLMKYMEGTCLED
jgi:cytochrome o ubiquinol oxidase subunit 2